MKAEELRIGNYVCTSYMKKSVFKVNAIHSDRLYFESIVDNFKSDTIPIYVEPIKLTEEWLLKSGFKKILNTIKGTDLRDEYDLRFVRISRYMDKFSFKDTVPLNYFHQLQNLYFALTGEELTIKL